MLVTILAAILGSAAQAQIFADPKPTGDCSCHVQGERIWGPMATDDLHYGQTVYYTSTFEEGGREIDGVFYECVVHYELSIFDLIVGPEPAWDYYVFEEGFEQGADDCPTKRHIPKVTTLEK
jgi:hypothetical protein